MKSKKKKKWVFENLLAEFDVYKKTTDDIQKDSVQHGLSIKDMQAEIRRLRDDIKAAKSMAETAKRRTEVDYSKCFGKSDGKIIYNLPEEKVCATCKHAEPMNVGRECVYLNDCYKHEHWEVKDNMAKTIYKVMFDNGNAVTFDSDVNIDFHKIGISTSGAGSLAFDDTFINLQHVVFINKETRDNE